MVIWYENWNVSSAICQVLPILCSLAIQDNLGAAMVWSSFIPHQDRILVTMPLREDKATEILTQGLILVAIEEMVGYIARVIDIL